MPTYCTKSKAAAKKHSKASGGRRPKNLAATIYAHCGRDECATENRDWLFDHDSQRELARSSLSLSHSPGARISCGGSDNIEDPVMPRIKQHMPRTTNMSGTRSVISCQNSTRGDAVSPN